MLLEPLMPANDIHIEALAPLKSRPRPSMLPPLAKTRLEPPMPTQP
jgi:hypothetical protein